MRIALPDLESTQTLGSIIAEAFSNTDILTPIFFYGDLGMGKTTLISALVKSLPGGNAAETSSPSFTLCNMYPTTPPVAHFDLYRQENGSADESLLDFLDGERHLVLVEWAERLPSYALPKDRLMCAISAEADGRHVLFSPHGIAADRLVTELLRASRSHPVLSRVNS